MASRNPESGMERDDTLSETLRRLELRLLDSDVRKSAANLGALLAEDFVEIASVGRMFNKAEIIASLRDEPSVERWVSDFQARELAPGVALVTYRATRRALAGGAAVSSLRSSIWKRTDGRWRMVFNQGTLTSKP